MPKQLPIDNPEKCPRCQQIFVCKAGSIGNCQCNNIRLNKKQTDYIRQRFTSCLCITCLNELQEESSKVRLLS
ncbi:cysteine-rich CWC family protein [Emticicia soli]|uniref:Cysteine-rich CWC family protein n=2 Tax=Emticicia soli TaxID=2027878 RepID=A0ABW5J3J8_9BACT